MCATSAPEIAARSTVAHSRIAALPPGLARCADRIPAGCRETKGLGRFARLSKQRRCPFHQPRVQTRSQKVQKAATCKSTGRACLILEKGGTFMSRKVGQIIARGERRWLVRVYLGRDRETRKTYLPQSNDVRLSTARTGVPHKTVA